MPKSSEAGQWLEQLDAWYDQKPEGPEDYLPAPRRRKSRVNAAGKDGGSFALRLRVLRMRWDGKRLVPLYGVLSVAVCVCMVLVLLVMVASLPDFGSPDNPAVNEVPQRYIEQGVEDTGAVNIVAGMILDYRAFDTFGESSVLFVAVCAALMLLRNQGKPDPFDTLLHEMEEPRHDIILKKIATLLVPMIAIFGMYVVLNGHLSPGGGFSGGAIMGASMILYTSAFGTRRAGKVFSYRNCRRVISVALLFYGLVKSWSFFTGANHMDTGVPMGTPGSLFSGGLILPLNIAVGLIVACTMYIFYILFSKGEME